MKYPIDLVSNVRGYVTTDVVDVLDCNLDAALEHFKNAYDGIISVDAIMTYEADEDKYYQVPAITCTQQDGDNWQIYRMPLWVSE